MFNSYALMSQNSLHTCKTHNLNLAIIDLGNIIE